MGRLFAISWFLLLVGAVSLRGQSAQTNDYVLQPSDLLRIEIFQEPELSREFRITQENTVMLPLVGSVEIGGLSLRDAESRIRRLYDADFLVNPQITMLVLEYGPRTVNVLGAVNNSGVVNFPLEQPLTLLDAIARAGGFSRLANRRNVQISRVKKNGTTETFTVNAEQIIEGNTDDKWLLKTGDVINVQERLI